MHEKFRRLGKESVIYGMGRAVGMFAGFLLLPVFTRVFSPAEYGVIDVIATMTSLGGIVLTAGTETALSYYFFKLDTPEERKSTITTTAAYMFAVNGFVALVVWVIAERISVAAFGTPDHASYIRLAALSLPFVSVATLHANVLRLHRKPWAYLGLNLPRLLLTLALNMVLVVGLRVGVIGVFATNLTVGVLFALIETWVNRAYIGASVDFRRMKAVVTYGAPLVIGGLSMWSINYLDRYFLLRYTDLTEVGIYAVGLKLAQAVALVTMAFRIANGPFQFEISSSDDAPRLYERTLTYFVLGVTVCSVALALYARPLVSLLAPPAYSKAYIVVGLAALSHLAYGVYQIVSVGLLITKRTGLTGSILGLGAGVNVGFLYLLVPPLGMIGAAVATLLTHATVVALLYVAAQRVYPIPYDLTRVGRTVAAAGAVVAIGYFIPEGAPIRDAGIATVLLVLYLLCIPGLALLPRSDLSQIRAYAAAWRTSSPSAAER